jgi:hypothetical protein
MEPTQKIPGDRLVLGMLSVFRTLVWVLSRNGAINLDEYVTALCRTPTGRGPQQSCQRNSCDQHTYSIIPPLMTDSLKTPFE